MVVIGVTTAGFATILVPISTVLVAVVGGVAGRGISKEGGLVAHSCGVGELGLSQGEEGAGLGEGGEWVLHGDDGGDVGEARVEVTNVVEDEHLAGDGGADVLEGV